MHQVRKISGHVQRVQRVFLSRNTIYSGKTHVVDCRGNPSRKTRWHFMVWYTAHVYVY